MLFRTVYINFNIINEEKIDYQIRLSELLDYANPFG